jgi:hypothetical protein
VAVKKAKWYGWIGVLLALLGGLWLARYYSPVPAQLPLLNIVPRAEWGAHEPRYQTSPNEHGLYHPLTNPEGWRVYDQPLHQILTTLVVHHSALGQNGTPLEIQELQFKHQQFADIAYHFVIGNDGQIYAGRDLQVRGAHTGGYNTGTVGVVLTGNFQNDSPSPLQLASLVKLAQALRHDYGIRYLSSHRDFQVGITECPGEHLYERLPDIAQQSGLIFSTAGYRPPTPQKNSP